MKVAQEVKKAQIAWQIRFAHAPKRPQIGLQQRKEAFRPILMHVPTRVFLLRVVDILVEVARERPIAAGRVGQESAAPLHSDIGGLLHRLDGKVPRRLDDAPPRAADPGDDRGAVFVVMTPVWSKYSNSPSYRR